MGSPIAESWVYATVRIENEWGQSGTGFLVARKIDEASGRVFLVTNKHVVNEDPRQRQNASALTLFMNIRADNGVIHARATRMPLKANGDKLWREHCDPHVDVLAVDVTAIVVGIPQLEKKWATYELFATPDVLLEQEITQGEEVVVIGYPLGLAHARTNSPLVRQGMVATNIGERISIPIQLRTGGTQQVEVPAFLVDSAVVPGASGSPVVLKPVVGRRVKSGLQIGIPAPYLLGIISITTIAPVQVGGRTFQTLAGLGVAYDAETVRETIELFFQ